jgi:hypothetical protein
MTKALMIPQVTEQLFRIAFGRNMADAAGRDYKAARKSLKPA